MSESFVAKLRRLRRCLEKSHPEGSWGSLWEAEKLSRGEGAEEDWTEEKSDAEIAEYEHRLRKAFGSKTHRRLPAIVAAMANIVGPNVLWEAVRDVHQSEHEEEREDLDEDCPF
jgi:adenine-specific DNA glycosylase